MCIDSDDALLDALLPPSVSLDCMIAFILYEPQFNHLPLLALSTLFYHLFGLPNIMLGCKILFWLGRHYLNLLVKSWAVFYNLLFEALFESKVKYWAIESHSNHILEACMDLLVKY